VLRLIEENPEMSQRQIADELGVSLGGVNYCLKALVDKGLIKVKNFRNSNNKMAYAYFLTAKGIKEKAALTKAFLKRKMKEYELLKAEIESLKHEI
jgi:EPS-associated MarR family transcriptional regulator